ncbi:hypothetical protein [Actinopolymorpha pittospori]|uniref:Endonuclease/Exonuclease/phosphatase family protein n=1 Tax=Actinopolymorpha pittospori TaxID=648752 RepID=A0A927R6Z6_9ACTN|nr:hypothetical protein [Actinopolymorpha pittospori]MBE1603679.1 hypothetical protein [Actinopolymorpha pittospori]
MLSTNTNEKPEPQDRIGYVDYNTTGGLKLVSSDTLTLGWPSATNPSGNSWASDHAAVVSRFSVSGNHKGH